MTHSEYIEDEIRVYHPRRVNFGGNGNKVRVTNLSPVGETMLVETFRRNVSTSFDQSTIQPWLLACATASLRLVVPNFSRMRAT